MAMLNNQMVTHVLQRQLVHGRSNQLGDYAHMLLLTWGWWPLDPDEDTPLGRCKEPQDPIRLKVCSLKIKFGACMCILCGFETCFLFISNFLAKNTNGPRGGKKHQSTNHFDFEGTPAKKGDK